MKKLLMTTAEAAEATGLSAYELRRGWKQGIYPAIEIGMGEKTNRLRWNMDALQEAIMKNLNMQIQAAEARGFQSK